VQIDTDAIAEDVDGFAKGRIPAKQMDAFKKYIEQYDSSIKGYFQTKSFLTMLFSAHNNPDSRVLKYVINPDIQKAIKEGRPLGRTELYDAVTDYVTGMDAFRQKPQWDDKRIREEIIVVKNELAQKAFDDIGFQIN
jgi:hypothetical protein